MDNTVKDILFSHTWTPKALQYYREYLGLTQKEVGEILHLSNYRISQIENGNDISEVITIAYGTLLERYYAYKQGYLPSYRKIGTNVQATLEVKM
jgi:transcriptional regulator with XRE-family HTH domain